MQIIFLMFMFILGACFGSFLCCLARRIKYRQTHKRPLGHRSVCPHCKYQLKWYDNIPIVSWLILHGKCRKCHHKIGILEIASEILTALAFLLLNFTIDVTTANAFEWAIFGTVMVFSIILIFLAIYDGAYGELPTPALLLSIVASVMILVVKEAKILSMHPFSAELIYRPIFAVLVLGGLYLAIYMFSKGKWVGDGDWLLGTAIGIALFDPWLALITLFLSNFLATIVMYPFTKTKKTKKVHFGPFLVAAFIITYVFSEFFLSFVI
ncbi:prepilin peptidase [Candidatus Saccharibacteria bacterium]|nr:prepilin peptidase [Candidatus Saccharibacteria bacterium]